VGGLSDPPTPLLYFTPPPPLCEIIRSSDVRGTGFFNLKKSPFEKHPCYKFHFKDTSFFTGHSPFTEYQPNSMTQVPYYLVRGAESPGRERNHVGGQ
jgi:hypothetical protein